MDEKSSFSAKLTTKLEHLFINDPVVELKASVESEKLNQILQALFKSHSNIEEKDYVGRAFKFIVGGKLLLTTVEDHLQLYSGELNVDEILSENVVEIEFIYESEPPEPVDAIPHDDWVSSVDANQEFIITGSYDNSIKLISVKSKSVLITIKNAHSKPITSTKIFSSTNLTTNKQTNNNLYVVSSGHDEVSKLWKIDISTKKFESIATFAGHSRSVNCSDVLDNLVATGSFDESIKIWSHDFTANQQQTPTKSDSIKKRKTRADEKSIPSSTKTAEMTLTGHSGSVSGVKWLKGGHEFNSIASSSLDNSVMIWDVEVGECKGKYLSAKPLLGLDYSKHNNLIIAAACDRHIRAWDTRSPENATAKSLYISHSAWVSTIVFSSTNSNHFVSGGYDNLVKLWDVRSPKACLYDLIGHHNKVLEVNCSNTDLILSGSADSTLKMFRTKK